jgi:hypothetical protein
MTPQRLAKLFHETYNRLASSFDNSIQQENLIEWEQLSPNERALLAAVCSELSKLVIQEERQRCVSLVLSKKLWFPKGTERDPERIFAEDCLRAVATAILGGQSAE